MKWARVAADEWVCLYLNRGEVARIYRTRWPDPEHRYVYAALDGSMGYAPDLKKAKRSALQQWRRAERKYAAAVYTLSSPLDRASGAPRRQL